MGFVNRVVRLAALVVLVAVVLALALPCGAVAVLAAGGLFTGAAWSGLFSWSVLELVVLGVLAGEVLHVVPRD